MKRYVLPLTTVGDQYTYFSCPGTQFLSIQVFNQAVDIGFGSGYPAAIYGPTDEYLALTNASWPRSCDEVRIKNHVPGKAAQIQITAQGPEDLPTSTPLGVGNSPNYLTVNPDGTIGATFSGKVQASELDLTANPGGSPINWLNSSGTVVATIVSDASGNLTLGPGDISGSSFTGGTISGTSISGGTIVGSVIETSSGNPKILLDAGSDVLQFLDGSGNLQIQLSPAANGLTFYLQGAPNGMVFSSGGSTMAQLQASGSAATGSVSLFTTRSLLTAAQNTGSDNGNYVDLVAYNAAASKVYNAYPVVGTGQSSFVQVGSALANSTTGNFQVFGQFNQNLSIASGANQTFTFTDGNMNTSGGYQVIGHLHNGNWLDHCGWCITGETATSVSFSVANMSSNTATGTFSAMILCLNGTSA